ncbi:CdaR family transcriptional regulator [Glutamicibacter arilaitensis]|uniref:CdaR family transcriptional regulator n=1 Tax=Glutamicibacter arilaitensis TaxID=256701 RepID=UPI003A90E6E9
MNQKEQPRLASALAQKVVDTIAPTINRNVNIMNAHGVIIASTDAARIGTRHEGSAEAISRNGIIRVSLADSSAGMQPGVNVPLTLNGQLCGVVGVTGVPHEVEPLAGLIALTVQLLFAQDYEHSRSARRETEARDIISALIAGRVAPEVIDRSLAANGLRGPKRIEAWLPRSSENPLLEEPAKEHHRTSWISLSGAYWRICTAQGPAFAAELMDGERFLVSMPVEKAADLMAETETLRVLLGYPALVPRKAQRRMWSREIAVAIARTPARSLEHAAAPAQQLNEEQAKTLLVVSTAASMSQAAKDLHIHRNTLVQRLERISQVSGVDIRHSSESLKVQHAIYARVALGQLHIF